MDFQHEPGRYFLEADGKPLAEINYTTNNDCQTKAIN